MKKLFERFFVSKRMFNELYYEVMKVMVNQAETVIVLDAVVEKLDKVGGETTALLAEVEALKALVGQGGESSPELLAAVDRVVAKATFVDGLVKDPIPV
jgi:hypothetical protein